MPKARSREHFARGEVRLARLLRVDIDQGTFPDELDCALKSCLADPAARKGSRCPPKWRENPFDKYIQQILDTLCSRSIAKRSTGGLFPLCEPVRRQRNMLHH